MAEQSSGSRDELTQIVRECVRNEVRNEMEMQRSGRQGNTNLLVRTRELIGRSARSASREVANSLPETSFSTPSPTPSSVRRLMPAGTSSGLPQADQSATVQTTAGSGSKRASTYQHPWRLKKEKQKNLPPQEFYQKAVHLLDKPGDENEIRDNYISDYSIKDDMILLKGFIEIGTGQTEAEIRESINELLKQRFPLVRPDHFDFVKRDRNKVTTPVVNESLKWDYKHLKQLCGQGKIYVRLNISRECIDMTTDSQSISSDEDEDLPTFPSSNITKHTSKKSSAIAPMPSSVSNQHDVVEIVHESVNPPSSSNIPPENGNTVAGSSVATRSQIDKERLCELLPFATEAELEGALSEFGAIDSAANALLRDPNIPAADENMEEGDDLSFVGITSKLGKKLTGKRKKLEIDEDDLVSDAIAYYKSIEFDAHCPLRITYASQPAIDSGGILC